MSVSFVFSFKNITKVTLFHQNIATNVFIFAKNNKFHKKDPKHVGMRIYEILIFTQSHGKNFL